MPWHEPVERLENEVAAIEDRLDKQVDVRFSHVETLLYQLQKKLVHRWMIAIIGLLIVAFGIWLVAHKADTTATQVQVQRHTYILQACQDQNNRNAKTIAALRANTAFSLTPQGIMRMQRELAAIGIHATPAAVRRFDIIANGQNAQTIRLINALAPHQDCQALVQKTAPLQ